MSNYNLVLEAKVEFREDRVAAWSRNFGFFAYGKTEREAITQYINALKVLFESFDTEEQFKDYLNKKGVV